MAHNQITLFPPSSNQPLPEGFTYREEVIPQEEESRLITQISALPFKEFQFRGYEGKRRTVSFGWRYDFDLSKALPAEPIPEFLHDVYSKVQDSSGLRLQHIGQVLVTEYAPGAAIGWHKDRPAFGNVLGLSLASTCTFRLRKSIPEGGWDRASLVLKPRSAYLAGRSCTMGVGTQHSSGRVPALLDHFQGTTGKTPYHRGMKHRERELGPTVAFLLPSLKLKEPSLEGRSVENRLHIFLMERFGGYTAQAGNIFGYWRENGRDTYGEHREFNVAVTDLELTAELKEFVAGVASELGEECIYFRTGGKASLVYPEQP